MSPRALPSHVWRNWWRRGIVTLLLSGLAGACSPGSTSSTTAAPESLSTSLPPVSTTAAPAATTAATTTSAPDPCADLIPDNVEELVRQTVDSGESLGLVVGIVSPCGTEVYARGRTAVGDGAPVDQDTVFEIGSTGKAFTGVLLAAMAQENEVSLSDPMERYLPPEVSAPHFQGRSITLLDLATNTSGLPNLPDNFAPVDELRPYADYTREQMYEALAGVELTRDPGSVYEYSNFGMGVLGHLLELQSGRSYEDLVVQWITDELGMPDTRVTPTPSMESRLATGYRDGEPFPLWDNPTLAGAGALRSTVRDLLTFLAANVGLQESDLYDAMRLSHRRFHGVDPTLGVGLGWHILVIGDDVVVEQHGATGGYWCFLGLVEDRQVGVVVLANTFHDVDAIGHELLKGS